MADDARDDWIQHKLLVLQEIKDLKAGQIGIKKSVTNVQTDVTILKTQIMTFVRVWAPLLGVLGAVATSAVKHLLGF